MSLSAINSMKMEYSFQWNVSKTITGLSSGVVSTESKKQASNFTLGVGAGQANDLYWTLLTIATSADQDIDLSAALENVVNDQNVTAARVKGLLIHNLSVEQDSVNGGSATSITIFGGVNPWSVLSGTDTLTLPLGGWMMLCYPDATGVAVSSGSADNLRITNDDGSNAAKVVLGLLLADA